MSHEYRSTLPIVTPTQQPVATVDVRDSTTPPRIDQLRPPKGAPNVLFSLLDDMGFGAPSAYGGPCEMPNAEALAASGLRFNRFHTTALCSPTRAALLSGRNHHAVGMAAITEVATSYPGSNSARPPQAAPLAEMLRLNGYNTAAFGKWHQTPVWETSQAGPFEHWPTGEGFEKFYGFLGGEVDQWAPTLYAGTEPIDTPRDPDYHLSVDLADRTISYIREQQAMMPDKPFFVYLAFGATHAPHHAPKEYIDAYRGKFDQGWDAVREETLERQKKLGVVPADAELTPRPESLAAWDSLDDDRKRLFARMMETYAAFATHTDEQVGRVLAALDELDIADDTLIVYMLGDNGASAEGNMDGTLNEYASYNVIQEHVDDMVGRIDDIGSHLTFNHYPAGWAHAMDTPYQWTKQCASHWGGTRNGMLMRWPNGFAARGEERTQFTHVIDLAPTVLRAAGIPEPTTVNGVAQMPLHGQPMNALFDDADAPEEHSTQYFEIFGNRGIYHEGWSAVTLHQVPWDLANSGGPFADDTWELYAPDDYTQVNDIASEHPAKLRELQDLFLLEGAKYQVFPMDDRKVLRTDPQQAGRPDLWEGRTEMTLYEGMTHLSEPAAINVKNRSHTITATFTTTEDDATGPLIVQGGRFGGWALYLDQGKPGYANNWVNQEIYRVVADTPLPAGSHTLRCEFSYDGGGVGKGGSVVLLVDGEQVAAGRVENTCGYLYSFGDTMDVAIDDGPRVVEDYETQGGRFEGRIERITINVDPLHHHDPEGMLRAVMGRQ